MAPARLTRVQVPFKDATPQAAAGRRSEPAVSEPRAIGTQAVATEIAEPAEEPPVMRVVSQGLRAWPMT
mgnify:CR=1 FL=1